MEEDKIIVQGLEYKNPKRPPFKSIRNSEKPVKFQKWSRHEEYLKWSWNTDPKEGDIWFKNPAEGQLEWYEEEIHRVNFGEWVMIRGEAIYINKFFYFFLQWHTLQEGIYPNFRDTSLEFFRFYEMVDDDPFTLGICGIKGRRLGMSSHAASIQLQVCLLEDNNLHGIVSKTNTDGKELFYMIRFSLENLPVFLIPEMRNIGEKELFFGTPAQRISKNNKTPNVRKGLNNRAGYLAPAENSYDGRRLRTIIIDEAAKFEECDVSLLFSKISETLVTGASVVGKVLMFSTVNAMNKGGGNFKAVWDDSDRKEAVVIGQTTSRLERFYIEGFRGVLGYIDEYGFSVIDKPTPEQTEFMKTVTDPKTGKLACPNPYIGAKEYRQIRRDMLAKDPEKLAEEKRKFPFTWQEVFKSANNQCYFNTEDLNNRKEYLEGKLEEMGRNPNTDELGRRGWFKKLPSGRVIFVDDEEKGLWYIHELLSEQESNKFDFKNGKQFPTNTAYGAAGMDAFANANKTAEKGSNAAITIRKRYSSAEPLNSGIPVALFLGRTTTKREFHVQCANALIYYGVIMGGERSPTDWVDFFYEEKLENYLLTTERKSDGLEIKGYAPQNKQQREEHLTEQMDSSLHDHDKIPFIGYLRDRLLFDIDERTLYDVAMSDGYALMTLKAPYKIIQKENKKRVFLQKGRILN